MSKKIREMTAEERLAYNRERYAKRQEKNTLQFTIHNCPPELLEAFKAILEAK